MEVILARINKVINSGFIGRRGSINLDKINNLHDLILLLNDMFENYEFNIEGCECKDCIERPQELLIESKEDYYILSISYDNYKLYEKQKAEYLATLDHLIKDVVLKNNDIAISGIIYDMLGLRYMFENYKLSNGGV